MEQSSTNAKHSVNVKYFLYLLKNVSIAQFKRISTAYNFPPKLYLTLSKEHRCWVLGHKIKSQPVIRFILSCPPTVGNPIST